MDNPDLKHQTGDNVEFGIENLNLLATVSEADYDFKNLDAGVSTESVR